MVYLYILKNEKGKYYTGITSLDPQGRLEVHNKGEVRSTSHNKYWQLIYTEAHGDYKRARKREKQIKDWHGGNAFKKLIARAAGSSNGRTRDSGSRNLGPNPSPAAGVIRK